MSHERRLVLVVDDDAQVRGVLERMLTRARFEVVSAQDGIEGLAMAGAYRPDLIILDVSMPRLGGYGLCAALRGDLRTSRIPILMLTALGTREDVARGLDAGADAYVTKPFEVRELLARAGGLLERASDREA